MALSPSQVIGKAVGAQGTCLTQLNFLRHHLKDRISADQKLVVDELITRVQALMKEMDAIDLPTVAV